MFLYLVWFSVFMSANSDGTPEQKMQDAKLMPQYFDFGTAGDLQVVYDGNYALQSGNEIPILSILKAPTVTYDLRGCDYGTVMSFDPDTPAPIRSQRIFLLWFVFNVPVGVLRKGYGNEQGGNPNAKYTVPVTPTGNHRYVTCLYCQQRFIKNSRSRNDILQRSGIHPRALAAAYQLGNPVACNFFYLTAADVDTKGVPLADQVKAANEDLGNRDKTGL